MLSDLKDRFGPAALITGASDGIGRAFAEALAGQGFDLVLVARREALLQTIAVELSATYGIRATVIAADLSDPVATAALLDRTWDIPIGLFVAAAGFGSLGDFLTLDPAQEANMVDLNCRALVILTHDLAARMTGRGKGGIVMFSSLVGFQGVPGSATYAATKGFVQGFAEALAVELRPLGVTVLSVAPGPVETGFGARAGMHLARAEDPATVARVALKSLRSGGTVRPGKLAKALGWSLALLPRWGRVRVLGRIMQGMTPKARKADH
jgi:uncharacterized protein